MNFKRFLSGILSLIFTGLPVSVFAFPRNHEHRGTATTTSSNYTAPFNPSAWCFTNESPTVDIFVNITSATATTANDSGNITLKANQVKCYRSADVDVLNTFTVAVITAASTATYRLEFFRGR